MWCVKRAQEAGNPHNRETLALAMELMTMHDIAAAIQEFGEARSCRS
jgi:hypothetical protein